MFDRKIFESDFGDCVARGDTTPDDAGETSEEPFDERTRDPPAQSEGVDPYDAPDAQQSLLVIAPGLASCEDSVHLDRLESRFEERSEFVRLVLTDVKRVFAVRVQSIGSRDERDPVWPKMSRERVEVVRGVGEVFDDLEARDQVECVVPERHRLEVRAQKACGRLLFCRFVCRLSSGEWGHPVDGDDPGQGGGELSGPVPRARAHFENVMRSGCESDPDRLAIGGSMPQEVDSEQTIVRVEAFSGEGELGFAHLASRAAAKASRVNSGAKERPIKARDTINPKERTMLAESS